MTPQGKRPPMPTIDGLEISLNDHIQKDEVLDLYRANGWSAAEKPDKLLPALRNAHSLVTARLEGRLIGIGNAISDGLPVVSQ